ncbi:hypothetical protein GJR96_16770 [Haloferax sp. MBLA0076]|uniref:MarR family transcriptional regulator n=1 Tax=Haloferax litoreum TaxID=2666140 RepID=A0A6A8GL25_9EURY|nr:MULTISPECIES: hypothetical protein [Haloferax]KAB1190607.1 hypothetical protein Hfx1148_16715 [Haloferax sp. CBA1148]MRX23599.1 hypothetical protein [Haloferax litoreum]
MGTGGSEDNNLPIAALKRADALAALLDGPLERSDLMETLDVSRTTIHRIVRGLESKELLVQDGVEFKLSPFGETVAREVTAYRRRITAAQRLQPFFETLTDRSVELEAGLFDGATMTESKPTNPYAPVARFMELLRDSRSLHGFDTTTVAPIYVEEIRDEILGGMETDVVYLSAVVEEMVETYPDAIANAVDAGQLTLSTHDDLPFGLAIFEDRVGLGGYDETGLLSVFVDTDSSEARDWAMETYQRYRDEAEQLDALSSDDV